MTERNPIKELRESVNITQRELADALDVHHSYIANLEGNLINFDEEDLDEQSKIRMIFEKLAKWSNQDAAALMDQQKKCTENSVERITKQVKDSLAKIPEDWLAMDKGDQVESADEIDWFISILMDECNKGHKSPVTVLREAAGVTQRNFALATGASQAYIARVEKGELQITGPRTGSKVMLFMIDAIAGEDGDGHKFDALHETIENCQDDFMKAVKQKTKQNVMAAFEKLVKDKGEESKEGKDVQ